MAGPSIATQLKAFHDLTQKQVQRASARALNRAVTSMRLEASKRVREIVKIKAGEVNAALVIDKAKAKETLVDQAATMVVKPKPIPLYAFSPTVRKIKTARGVRLGVTVKVKDVRKIVTGAFIATVGAGHTGIFKRKTDDRLPIKELFSTSVLDIFKDDFFVRRLLIYGQQKFKENFDRELKYELSKGDK